tara:strand:- start:2310 stop:2444 length:135 start_codon:yes stop_codon:yes gene_type:complete
MSDTPIMPKMAPDHWQIVMKKVRAVARAPEAGKMPERQVIDVRF